MAPDDRTAFEPILRLLAAVMREAGLTNQAVEKRLGWANGTVARLLAGRRELRVRQLMAILGTAGMRPSAFFTIVEEAERLETSLALRSAIIRGLSGSSPLAEGAAANLTDEELDARIESAVERVLATRKPAGG